jgi:NAD(P)-dependent dehydrogenase (short-subunit alcohol dehydrogenase family)
VTGLEASPKLLDYAATKGAIHAFTKSLARNLVDKGSASTRSRRGPYGRRSTSTASFCQ